MSKGRGKWGSRRANGPPEGEGFTWHTRELLTSAAWRTRSINCARLIDYLEIEHLSHGANDNGRLLAPYTDLMKFGISRGLIPKAITEAERKGLIDVKRGGLRGVALTELSRYRLTYYWTRTTINGLWEWHLPTDEWKRFKADEPRQRYHNKHATVPVPVPASVPVPVLGCKKSSDFVEPPEVPVPVPLSISREGMGNGHAHILPADKLAAAISVASKPSVSVPEPIHLPITPAPKKIGRPKSSPLARAAPHSKPRRRHS